MTARMAATLDRLSEGRVLINVIAGGDPVEMHGDGVWFGHGERYKAIAEYLTVWRQFMQGQTVRFNKDNVRVEGGKLLFHRCKCFIRQSACLSPIWHIPPQATPPLVGSTIRTATARSRARVAAPFICSL